MKKYIYIILTAVILVLVYFLWSNSSWSRSSNNSSTFRAPNDWMIYENTAYNYKISYPRNVFVTNTQEMNPNSINKSNDIQIHSISVFAFSKNQSTSSILIPNESKIDGLSIKEISEIVYKHQVDDKNPNLKNKKVGKLKEIMFAGEKAYSFTLTEGFSTGLIDGVHMGYTLIGIHNYIFVEKNSIKFVIHYPIGDEKTEKIMNSFQFIDSNSVGANQSDWLTYTNVKYNYQIKYPPGNIGPKVKYNDPAEARSYPVEQTEDLRIVTPRGVMGIVSLRIPFEIGKNPIGLFEGEGGNKQEDFVSLPLKDFTEQVWQYNLNNVASQTKYGIDNKMVGKIKNEVISNKEGFSFSVSGIYWLGHEYMHILIPGYRDAYIYTFIEDDNGDKFIIWYPADDPVFEEMKNSFKFI